MLKKLFHIRGIKNLHTVGQTVPKRIFSGIQPTGAIHLGNYLGAVKQWVELQDCGEDMTLSIVDLHSMTIPHVPKQLSHNILEMTATLLACGINHEKVVIFQQSAVPQHTELCWQLSCICTMARLAHLPQFKEKSASLKDVPLGLYTYPVLQAADILLYKATHVPVGDDQVQHLQLTQELAKMFNSRFGHVFPIPHAMVTGEGTARIKSLRNPDKKMSKSDEDPKSRICLTDSDDEILKSLKKAVTDFTSEVTYDPIIRPGVSNLVTIHAELSGKTVEEICNEFNSLNTGKYKLAVAEAVIEHVSPIRKQINDYMAEPEYLLHVLESGAEKAAAVAEVTAKEVRQRMGLRPVVKRKRQVVNEC